MREKILAMTAGRTLDWMIAQDVMGINDKIFDFAYEAGNFNYSTDISAAWEVFTNFDFPMLEKGMDEDDNDYFVCKIGPHRVIADTAPLAICRAALLAVICP